MIEKGEISVRVEKKGPVLQVLEAACATARHAHLELIVRGVGVCR